MACIGIKIKTLTAQCVKHRFLTTIGLMVSAAAALDTIARLASTFTPFQTKLENI
jgi:hypothetical protein